MTELITVLLQNHPILAPAIFIVVRAIPVVIAPIPGIFVDLVGISIFGWRLGFILALVGVHLGAFIAFMLARIFREPLVSRFLPLQKLHEWEDSYSEKQKFWMLVSIRIATSPFFDYLSYAAGLTKMSVSRYLFSTFLGTLPLMLGIYYVGGISFTKGPFVIIAFFAALLIPTMLLARDSRLTRKIMAFVRRLRKSDSH